MSNTYGAPVTPAKRIFVTASAAFAIGGLTWLVLKLLRARSDRADDDQMFSSPSGRDQHKSRAVTFASKGDIDPTAHSLVAPLESPYVAPEVRKEAMKTLKAAVFGLGGHVDDPDDKEKDGASSDDSYETDLPLELEIGNEMERMLRAQIMELIPKVFSPDGTVLASATTAPPPAAVSGKSKHSKTAKKQSHKSPLVELLEMTFQYLDLSGERLVVQQKVDAQKAVQPISRRVDADRQPVSRTIGGARGYGDAGDEDEEEAMDWRHAPRHQKYGYGDNDDDDDDDAPWKLHGSDDDDEEDWEDEDDEEWDDEYDEEEDEDDFEEAWLRASGQPSGDAAVADAERAEFEKFLIERCFSKELQALVPTASPAPSADAIGAVTDEAQEEWEDEEEDPLPVHARTKSSKKKAAGGSKQKIKRGHVASQQERYEGGEWVDF